MKMRISRVLMLSAVLAAPIVGYALTRTEQAGQVQVANPWVEAAAMGSSTKLRMTIRNELYDDVQIVKMTTPAATETAIMFADESADPRTLDALAVPAGQNVGLDTPQMWVALNGLTRDLKDGEAFPMTLHFADGDSATVEVEVHPLADAPTL